MNSSCLPMHSSLPYSDLRMVSSSLFPSLSPSLALKILHLPILTPRGGGATSKVGGGGTNEKGHFLGKKGTYKGKSQSENKQFLDIGIYPLNLITLSGMISIFVSLYTSYKILLFKASYLAVGCDGRKNHLRARTNIRFVRSQCKNYIL